MIDLSKCKVGADVICDDGDHLYPPVALFYEYDPDDPTPLFGDSSPEAVDTERLLLDLMTVRGSNAGSIHAYINDIRCAAFRTEEKADLELKRSSEELKKSETTRRKGTEKAGERNRAATAELWNPYKVQFLSLYRSGGYELDAARRRVWRTMGIDEVIHNNLPCKGREPPMKTLRRQLPDPDK